MENTLGHLDQVLFLSQQALGHSPVVQLTWVYDRPVDIDALRRFQSNLGRGPIGRRVARSPLPFGRHRWLAWPGPADVTVAPRARPRSELSAWTDEQGALPIDPESTPWRLAVQPLTEGGAAVTLVVSHTVGDGVALLGAVADAAGGVTADFGYPVADTRTRAQALRADFGVFLRSLPEMARAAASMPRSARSLPDWGQSQRSGPRPGWRRSGSPVVLRSVTAHIDTEHWDERAESLGGTSTSLFLGLVARLGKSLGWAAPDGSVNLVIPVSEREGEDDKRANALDGVTLKVHPDAVTSGLGEVRAGVKAALADLADNPNALGGPLALTPLVPKFLTRQVEVRAQQSRLISCSSLGDIDPLVNRPDGSDADWFALRTFWNRLACRGKPIERAGGVLFPVETGRVGDTTFITVCYATAEPAFTRQKLWDMVQSALDDFRITADIE